MTNLRRGGSVSLFFVEGELPGLQGAGFADALASQRFRTIEAAASEEMSVGWVCAPDPSGDSFPVDEIDLDRAVWLQVRIDKKKLPQRWVSIYRAAAERAAGRKLTGKERKALKDDLAEQLLPRVLPAVQIIDVLLDPKAKRVLLFSTSKAVRDEFVSLVHKTFVGVRLAPASALEWALRSKLAPEQRRYLEEVAPVNWPKQASARQPSVRQPSTATAPPDVDPLEVEA